MGYSGKAGFTDNINGSDISIFTANFYRSGPPAWASDERGGRV
jgi:hypothetical protein